MKTSWPPAGQLVLVYNLKLEKDFLRSSAMLDNLLDDSNSSCMVAFCSSVVAATCSRNCADFEDAVMTSVADWAMNSIFSFAFMTALFTLFPFKLTSSID